MSGTIGARIAALRQELGGKSVRQLEKGGLPGDQWVISNGLLKTWENEDPEVFSSEKVEKFLNHWGINRGWWRTEEGAILTKNITPVQKQSDNNGKPHPDEVWSQVEKSEKYTVVPTIILDKYEILSNREIESRETTLIEVRAAMKTAIAAKDQVIRFLEIEVAELRERLKQLPPAQDAQ